MKKNLFTKTNNLFSASKSYCNAIHCKWFALLLLIGFIAGCKKVEETSGIINVCPIVVSTDPLNNAVDVAYDKTISVTFNTDIKPSTVNAGSFVIRQGTQIISGTISPTAIGTVFSFKPDVPLLPFVKYTGTISNTVTDKFNTAMVSDYVWSFTTIPQITLSSSPLLGGTTTGSGTYAQGSTVTVSAVPRAGYSFTNWTDSGTVVVASTSPSYQFKMAGNRALVANFSLIPPTQYSVVISSNPVAGGSTFGSGSYNTGSTVTIIESPNTGYTFLNWTENGIIVSTNSNFQFVINSNRTFVANFSPIPALQFAVILTSSPPQGGTTTGSGSYTSGTSVTIRATPNNEYNFVSWTENGTIVSTSPSFTFPLNSNRIFVANFVINAYTVSISANPSGGGTVVKTPNQPTYNSGSLVSVTATTNAGFTFINWTEGTTIVSTNTNYSFLINDNRNLVANYSTNNYTLTVTTNPTAGGTVTKNPNQPSYSNGTSVQLTAIPNSGYTFTSWSGDASGSINPLNVVMNSNKNITANFTAIVPIVPLGTAANFGTFGGNAGVTNQGINTVINNGGLGTTAAASLITGFHDGLTGDVYTETMLNVGNVTGGIFSAPPFPGTDAKFVIAQKALADANIAYLSMSPAAKPGGTDPGAGELGGLTLAPGIYKSASGTFKISNGNLTLDAQGNPNASWIFQTAAGLTVGIAGPTGAKSVILINEAQAKNVFWYVGSAAVINGAGGGVMVGTIIASSGVSFSTAGNAVQTVLNGRAISLVSSVTMVNTTINNQ